MRELEAARFGSLFASPLLEHMWADGAELNVELRERVLEHARRHPGSEQTNVGGWHSEIGRLEFCGSAGERLVRHMREMTEEATLPPLRQLFPAAGTAELDPQRLGEHQSAGRFQQHAHAPGRDLVGGLLRR